VTTVVDASVVVAALIEAGQEGEWADDLLASGDAAAPQFMIIEATNILRRAELAGLLSSDTATLAYGDLLALRVNLFPYEPFADRVWQLRRTITAYDAWYVAIAESLDAPLATLDARLSRAPGPRCSFITPQGGI
jgi:predicted nucleic acid-binding protein